MPNQLEEELKAVHCTIAEIKREMKNTNNVSQREYLENALKEFEDKRLDLLKNIGGKIMSCLLCKYYNGIGEVCDKKHKVYNGLDSFDCRDYEYNNEEE